MNNRRSVYFVFKTLPDGSRDWEILSGRDFYALTLENRNLPPEQRRYFITSAFQDGDVEDRVIYESTREEYERWRKVQRAADHRRKMFQQSYDVVSLDALPDVSAQGYGSSEEMESAVYLNDLREEAARQGCWNADMFDMYLYGEERECPKLIAELSGKSVQMARRYREKFRSFMRDEMGKSLEK